MSVLMEFSMFPTDVGESKSNYVSEVIAMIRNSGYPYKLTAMGTIIETDEFSQSVEILQKAQEILEKNSNRIYGSAKFDIRKGRDQRLEQKIASIESKIGTVNK